MAKSKNYNIKLVTLIVDGRHHTGLMDGAPVNAEANNDSTIPHVDAYGEVVFAENADETGTITITYKHNSPALAQIRALVKARKTFSISLDDQNDPKVKTGGSECRVLKMPPLSRGTEVTGVEVQYFVADYDQK
jgi:hypothetical protein